MGLFDGFSTLFDGARRLFTGRPAGAASVDSTSTPIIPDIPSPSSGLSGFVRQSPPTIFAGQNPMFAGQSPVFAGQKALFDGNTSGYVAPTTTDGEAKSVSTVGGVVGGPDVGHVYTFSSLYNSAQKTYYWQWDEAYRRSREDALAMRRDDGMMRLLFERMMPSLQMPWHVEVKDENGRRIAEAEAKMTTLVESIPDLEQYDSALLWGSWYGRAAAHQVWGRCPHGITVTHHDPVSGDKIQHSWDGTPQIMISSAMPDEILGAGTDLAATVEFVNQSKVMVLDKPYWRDRYCVYYHDIVDSDFFAAEEAGSRYGVGIRHWLYWNWWLSQELQTWIMDYMQRVGLGVTVLYYEAGNATDEARALQYAKEMSNLTVVVWPRYPGKEGAQKGVERLDPPLAGVEALRGLMSYFDDRKEKFVVGQTLSSDHKGSGGLGGSGAASFQEDTKQQLIKSDCGRLASAKTRDLLGPMLRYNFPGQKWSAKFLYDIDTPDPEKKLEAITKAASIGVRFKEDEVRSLIGGMTKPEQGDDVVGGPQGGDGQPGQQGAGQPGQGQQGGGLFGGQQPGGDEGGELFDGAQPPPDGGQPQQPTGRRPMWIPYYGKNGGRGYYNPATGEHRYGNRPPQQRGAEKAGATSGNGGGAPAAENGNGNGGNGGTEVFAGKEPLEEMLAGGDEAVRYAGLFEDDHPRGDEDGRFVRKGGGGKSSRKEKPAVMFSDTTPADRADLHGKDVHAARKQLASGKLKVHGGVTSSPVTSDATGKPIKRWVELANGARVHPDELQRLKLDSNGDVSLSADERLTVIDPSNRGRSAERTFERAAGKAASLARSRPHDMVTIQSAHGYAVTRPREEWAALWNEHLRDDPHTSFSDWYDRQEEMPMGADAADEPIPTAEETSVDTPPDPFFMTEETQHSIQPRMFHADGSPIRYAAKKDAGQWITIGGSKGSDGKRHGGSPVYIENGRITKGHPSLTGKKIEGLKEEGDDRPSLPADATPEQIKAHKNKQAGAHRAEVGQGKGYARAKFAKTARQEGINPQHLHQLAAEMIEHDAAFKDEQRSLLTEARRALSEFGGQHKTLGARVGRGNVDASHVRGIDDVADQLKDRYADILGTDDPTGKLFELLSEGNPEPMGEEDAYESALEHLREHQRGEAETEPELEPAGVSGDDDDSVPFQASGEPKRYAEDKSGHEHGADGRFAGHGGDGSSSHTHTHEDKTTGKRSAVGQSLQNLGISILPHVARQQLSHRIEEALVRAKRYRGLYRRAKTLFDKTGEKKYADQMEMYRGEAMREQRKPAFYWELLGKVESGKYQAAEEVARYEKDAAGHDHKGKGEGGGQFTGNGGGGGGEDNSDKPAADAPPAKKNPWGKLREMPAPERKPAVKATLEQLTDVKVKPQTRKGQDLQQLPIMSQRNLGGGVNDSRIITLADGSRAVFKSSGGEEHYLRSGVSGRYFAREAAAHGTAELLGLDDLVPTTVVRANGLEVGSAQAFVPDAGVAYGLPEDKQYDGDKDVSRAAAFDFLIGNSDRHMGNWMVSNAGKLVLIDNGLSFPSDTANEEGGNTYLLDETVRRDLDVPPEVKQWAGKWPELKTMLRDHGFRPTEVALVKERLDLLTGATAFSDLYSKSPFGYWGSAADARGVVAAANAPAPAQQPAASPQPGTASRDPSNAPF